MHLSVDSTKSLETLRRDLLAACASAGLVVDPDAGRRARASRATAGSVPPAPPTSSGGSSAPPRSPSTFVVEIADPLPELRDAGTGPTDGRTWRISGYERGTPGGAGPRSRLSTMRPTRLLDLLGHPELSGPALRLEQVLERVLEDAAGRGGAPTRP